MAFKQKLEAWLGINTKEYEAGLDKAKVKTEGFGKSIGMLGKVMAGVFAVTKIVEFAKESVKMYDEQAKAEQALLVALKGRKDITERLVAQSSELQKKTLFGDEQTIQGAARLAMLLGQDEQAISKLLPLVQDLAQAKFEGNLVTAADLVAKSIGSSTNALSRYGIVIEGAVGSSQRLESAIEGLNKQVGGQAEAAAKVGVGSITQLKNAWGDLREELGKSIVNSNWFKELTNWLKAEAEIWGDKRLSFWEKMNGSPNDYAKFKKNADLAQKAFGIGGNLSGGQAWVAPWAGAGGKIEKQAITIEKLSNDLKDYKADLDKANVSDLAYIKNLTDKIKYTEEYIKLLQSGGALVPGSQKAPSKVSNLPSVNGVDTGVGLPGLVDSNVALPQMTKDLSDQQVALLNLTDAWASYFTNIDQGFGKMLENMAKSLTKAVMQMMAQMVIFKILSAITGVPMPAFENFLPGNLFHGVKSGAFQSLGGFANAMPQERLVTSLRGKEIEILLRRS